MKRRQERKWRGTNGGRKRRGRKRLENALWHALLISSPVRIVAKPIVLVGLHCHQLPPPPPPPPHTHTHTHTHTLSHPERGAGPEGETRAESTQETTGERSQREGQGIPVPNLRDSECVACTHACARVCVN